MQGWKTGLVGLALICQALNATAAKIVADVVYGHKDGLALVYDVIKPDRKANGAAVVYMVSGGWFSFWRKPEDRVPQFTLLLERGFTIYAVHHGSAPRFKVPDAVRDVRAALRHIREHAAEHKVDPNRLGIYGGSAGGHLSLMLGLDPAGNSKAGVAVGRMQPVYAADVSVDAPVAAVVAYYPPVDMRTRVGPSERFPALDFPADDAVAISPILHVSADDPPILLVHGDADDLVPLADSEILAKSLKQKGVKHRLDVIKGGDHGFRNPEHRGQATTAMIAWFEEHLLKGKKRRKKG